MSLLVFWLAWTIGAITGYTLRIWRPWRAFGDWLSDQGDRGHHGWRDWALVALLCIYDPRTVWLVIKWAFGWRPPKPSPRRTVAVSPEWTDGSSEQSPPAA